MQNSSDPTLATNVNPQSFKSQLKKLSGKSQSRKASKTGSAVDGVVNSKTAQTKPQVTKIKRLSGQEEPDNENDSSQNHASKSASADVSTNNLLPTNKEGADVGADSVTPVSNSVRIASLSMNEPQDSAKLFNTAFESQADTIVAQASMESTATIPAVASAPSFSLSGLGAGLGGLALAGGKGGSSGSSASSSSTTATPTASASISLSGFIAAGPIINPDGLKVEAFDASGNLLASTTSIQADGTFTVNLNNSYTGVIKVVVSDTNGNTANFVDEATGRGKSFGADPLVTIFYLPAGQTTFSVNINPLTTEAANNVIAALRNDLTKATSAVISSANLDIATKYGISDASNQEELLTDPPLLLIDSKGVMNPKFDPYGLALAIKSVVDDNPSMSMKDAVIALAQNPLYSGWSDGPTNWASLVYGFGAGFLKNSEPTGDPSISGNATQDLLSGTLTAVQQGQTLTASSANILDADGMPNADAISYQWQASSDSGSTWSDIAGASGTNATTFTTSQAQVGNQVRVIATYTDNFGKAEIVTSKPTLAIVNVDDAPTGELKIWSSPLTGRIELNNSANVEPLYVTSNINDLDGLPIEISYKWQASPDGGINWLDISGANSTFTSASADPNLKNFFSPTPDLVGKNLRLVANYIDSFGHSEIVKSLATESVTGLEISGIPMQNQTFTASENFSAISGSKIGSIVDIYEWFESSDGGNTWFMCVEPQLLPTFTLTQNHVGKRIRVVSTGLNKDGLPESVASSASLVIANVNDMPTGKPFISGSATQGLLSGTFTAVQQGQTLTASSTNIADADGMPNADAISYQWQTKISPAAAWTDITGASASTFTTTQDQVGNVVRVVATFTDNFGTQERVESDATASITNVNDLPRGNPDILEAVGLLALSGVSRVPQQGKTLKASFGAINDPDGTPNATGAFSCQWQASTNGLKWFDIVGATDSTFTTTQTQVGLQLRVVAKYTDKLGTPETVYSNSTRAVANVNDLPTGLPTITGTPTQGNVLNASSTNIADADGMPNADAISYQWQTKINPTAAWTDITGASASTFTTTQDQVGKVVRVVATFTDNFGTQERVESDPTLRITNVNDLPTGKPFITGSATQGQSLTALSDNIADADGMPETSAISYNWQFSVDGKTWFFILGATSDTFTTTQAQLGKQVRVVATYTDKFGTPETVTSDPISIAPTISPLLFPNTSTVATATQMGPTQTFAAGDVNGDGIADWVFAIGGIAGTITGIQKEMYVLFGNTSGTFDLKNSNDSKGFLIPLMSGMTGAIITYPVRATIVGYQNSIAGDFNGDGLGEIAVGTGLFVAEPIKTPNYISLVNQSTAITNSQLLLITGADRSFNIPGGFYAFDTGDMNGDGFSDLISGSYVTNTAHVFFGNTTIKSANVLQVDSLPANQGLKISDSQINPDLLLGFGVSSLGDANGDGYGDMAITHNFSADPRLGSREEVFVIFGKQGLGNIDVNNIRTGVGSQGYVINADPLLPFLGYNMSLNATNVAGDFNGDGLKDLVLEGQNYDHTAAKFYVVFGKQSTTPINLSALGTNGFSIALPTVALKNVINLDLEMARDTVANCGDINGDGIDDMLVSLAFNTSDALPPFTVPGAPLPNAPTKTNHLLSYVVYGKTDLTDIDLNNLGNQGFKVFEGTKTLPMKALNYFGNITSAGDINGDGLSDLIFDDYMDTNGGIPTIAFGSSLNQPISQWKVTHQGFGGNDTLTSSSNNLSETFIGGAGDDSIRGNGGADVMYGGAGDDVFYLNADNTNQLKSPMQANGRLARIDGGGGIDTLSLDGTDITLDLTSISNTRLQSIEKINLVGSGNTLKVSWQDIQNMTAMNLFNNTTTGWSGFSSNTMRYHQLAVDGQSTGSISFLTEGGWIKESFSALNINQGTAQNYNVYTNANHATQLLISTNIGNVI